MHSVSVSFFEMVAKNFQLYTLSHVDVMYSIIIMFVITMVTDGY